MTITTPATRVVHCSYSCCRAAIGRIEETRDGSVLLPLSGREVRYHRRNDGAYREVARGGRLARPELPLPDILVCPSCGRLNMVNPK